MPLLVSPQIVALFVLFFIRCKSTRLAYVAAQVALSHARFVGGMYTYDFELMAELPKLFRDKIFFLCDVGFFLPYKRDSLDFKHGRNQNLMAWPNNFQTMFHYFAASPAQKDLATKSASFQSTKVTGFLRAAYFTLDTMDTDSSAKQAIFFADAGLHLFFTCSQVIQENIDLIVPNLYAELGVTNGDVPAIQKLHNGLTEEEKGNEEAWYEIPKLRHLALLSTIQLLSWCAQIVNSNDIRFIFLSRGELSESRQESYQELLRVCGFKSSVSLEYSRSSTASIKNQDGVFVSTHSTLVAEAIAAGRRGLYLSLQNWGDLYRDPEVAWIQVVSNFSQLEGILNETLALSNNEFHEKNRDSIEYLVGPVGTDNILRNFYGNLAALSHIGPLRE